MGENHCRVARELWKEILFCPTGGFQILQDVSSRTCIPFYNSATGQKTITRNGVLMPNCLCDQLYSFMAQFLPDLEMHTFSWSPLKATFQTQDNHNPSLCFPGWILLMLSGTHIFKGIHHMQQYFTWPPHHLKTQIFHNLLSHAQDRKSVV